MGAPAHELLALMLRFGLSSYAAHLELVFRLQLPVAVVGAALRDVAIHRTQAPPLSKRQRVEVLRSAGQGQGD